MAAIGAEEFDFLVPELLIVAIKFAPALRTGYPKNFRHGDSWFNGTKSEVRITKSEATPQLNKSQAR
jgi:hypothetical protein